jgi:hypothetical protein
MEIELSKEQELEQTISALEEERGHNQRELEWRRNHISWQLYRAYGEFIENASHWKWVIVLIIVECLRLWVELQHLGVARELLDKIEMVQSDVSNLLDFLRIARG